MNQYNEISTLQYMGSKTRIISHICEPIIKNRSIKTVVDLFAGTGSVGYALKAHKNIISNDLECSLIFCNPALSIKSGAFTILIPPTPLMRPQSMAITIFSQLSCTGACGGASSCARFSGAFMLSVAWIYFFSVIFVAMKSISFSPALAHLRR